MKAILPQSTPKMYQFPHNFPLFFQNTPSIYLYFHELRDKQTIVLTKTSERQKDDPLIDAREQLIVA
jgi:MFS superfamily sulfate permease-like transporter